MPEERGGCGKKKIKGQLLVTWRRSISSSEHVVVSGLDGMGWDGTGQIYAHSFSLLIYCRNNTRLLLPAGPTKFLKKKSKEKKTKFMAKGMEWV
jgi:hypothetical protein